MYKYIPTMEKEFEMASTYRKRLQCIMIVCVVLLQWGKQPDMSHVISHDHQEGSPLQKFNVLEIKETALTRQLTTSLHERKFCFKDPYSKHVMREERSRGELITGNVTYDQICTSKSNVCPFQTLTECGVTVRSTKFDHLMHAGRNVVLTLIAVMCIFVFLLDSYLTTRRKGIQNKNFSYISEEISTFSGQKLEASWQFIFGFQYSPGTNITTYPFSINQYADEIVKEHKTAEELMKYEWSRYLSFKNFPMDCVMTPLRLAQAGFYYTGHGQEVKCFSCGVTNGSWVNDETAIQAHKRLSPNCKFIFGENTDNVTIHAPEYYSDIYGANRQNNDRSMFASGATGGPTDTGNRPTRNGLNGASTKATNNQKSGSCNETVAHASKGPVGQVSSRASVASNENNETYQAKEHTVVTGTKSEQNIQQTNERTEQNALHQSTTNAPCAKTEHRTIHQASASSPVRRSEQNIKHPDYQEYAARAGSFMGWTHLDIQDPVELAEAGFFYTGVKDFVRCYFCGIGLKNWENGDNPWTEHQRWSKSCGHLLQAGMTEDRHRGQTDQNESNSKGTPETHECPENSSIGHSDTRTTETSPFQNTDSASMKVELDSIAAQSVLEMGYSPEAVAQAIRKYKTSNGSVAINATAIMEILLETETDTNVPTKDTGSSSDDEAHHEHKEKSNCAEPTVVKNRKKSPSKDTNSAEARSLMAENKIMKQQMMCKVCLDKDSNTVFLPCGHMATCHICAVSLRKCPICRKLIRGTVRVYTA